MNVSDLDPAFVREMYADLERRYPDLWRICYPRIYSEPACGQYYSPKEPARQLLSVAVKWDHGMVGQSEMYEMIAASELVRYRVPMIWLGHDMAQAIRKTVPPGKIPWYTMPMPFPAAVFMVPKGALQHPSDGDVSFIAYPRFKTGDSHISKLVKGMPYGSSNGGMIFLAYCPGSGTLFHWNLPLDAYGDSVSIPDIENYVTHLSAEEQHDSGLRMFFNNTMTEEDNRMMALVAHYCFGSILLSNYRPDLFVEGTLRKKVEKKGERKEFWSPNILGEHYRIKREKVDLGGTHASPRFHWVRGAYKQQAYGPKMELRKQVWIEPYTRGLEIA
jgi:hypothetical protein